MPKSIGILKDKVTSEQNSFFMVKNLNEIAKEIDVTLFCDNALGSPMNMGFNSFFSYEAFNYAGPIITTDVQCLGTLEAIHSTQKKILYMWNPDWMYHQGLSYSTLRKVYFPSLEYIARNEYHADIIRKVFNKEPIAILDNWDTDKLKEVILNV